MSISDPDVTPSEGTVENIGYLPGKNIDVCERTSPSDCSNCSSPVHEQHSPDSYRSYSPPVCFSSSPSSRQSPAHSPHSFSGNSILRTDPASSPPLHDRPPSSLLNDHPPSPLLNDHPPSPYLNDHTPSPLLNDHPPSPLLNDHPPSPFLNDHPPSPFLNDLSRSPLLPDPSASLLSLGRPSSSLLTSHPLSPLLTGGHLPSPLLTTHRSSPLTVNPSPALLNDHSSSLLIGNASSSSLLAGGYPLLNLHPTTLLTSRSSDNPSSSRLSSDRPSISLSSHSIKYEFDAQSASPPRSPSPELPSLILDEPRPSVSIYPISCPPPPHEIKIESSSSDISLLPTSSRTSTLKLPSEDKTFLGFVQNSSSTVYGAICTSPRSPKFPPPPVPPLNPLNHTQNFEEPCSLRLSPSSSSPISLRKPFYSLSPKSERSDTKSPFMNTSSSSSPLPNFMEDDAGASTSENAPVADPSKETRTRPLPRPTEIVDVDQSQPCIVDLTCEDDNDSDDDVEIVSTDQPVVFLSESNSRRRNRKRKRHDSQRACTSTSSQEPIIISDSMLEPSSLDHSATVINVSDSPININESTIGEEAEEPLNARLESRHHGQLFGDLLDHSVVAIDHGSGSGFVPPNRGCTCYPPPDDMDDVPFCEVHHQFSGPSSSSSREGLREDRSRSPIPPPAQPLPPNRSVLEAPIPQDVLDDIASLYADGSRRSIPVGMSLYRRLLGTSPERSDVGERRITRSSRIAHPLAQSRPGSSSSSAFHRPVPQQQQQQSSSSSSSIAAVASTSSASPSEDSGALSCPICFESFQDIKKDGKNLSSTVCGHIFCTACLEASFKQAKQCPTCRKKLNKKQYHPLYI